MIILDVLKRIGLAIIAFGLTYLVINWEIKPLFALLDTFSQIPTSGIHANAGSLATGSSASLIALVSKAMAIACGLLFAVSCFSEAISDALLHWRIRVTAFVCVGYTFLVLYKPILSYIVWVVQGFFSFTASSMTDALQRQNALKTISSDAAAFDTSYSIEILAVAVGVTGLIAWYLTYKIVITGRLAWCQISLDQSKRSRMGFMERSALKSKPPPAKPTIEPIAQERAEPIKSVPAAPAKSPATKLSRNPAKDLLFGNLPLDQWPPVGADVTVYPWTDFEAARVHHHEGRVPEAIAGWQALVATQGLEALHYLQAWHFLRQNGVQPTEEEAKSVYGVVGEQGATSVLTAIYVDGQARLYSDQGLAVEWRHPDASLDPQIEAVLAAATMAMLKIKQSDPVLSVAKSSVNSIAFLTPSGVYVKAGASKAFEAVPIIKPVAESLEKVASALMQKPR